MSVQVVDQPAIRRIRTGIEAAARRLGFLAPLAVLVVLQQVLWPAPAGWC